MSKSTSEERLPPVPDRVNIDERTYDPSSMAVGLIGGIESWARAREGDVLSYDLWGADKSHNVGALTIEGVETAGDIVTVRGSANIGAARDQRVTIKFNRSDPLTARVSWTK